MNLYGGAGVEEARINASKLHNLIRIGGLAFPNIAAYYHVVMLENILQWWNSTNRRNWEWEQLGFLVSMSKWILIPMKERPKVLGGENFCRNVLLKIWKKYCHVLAPQQSLVVSFLYHARF